MVSKPDFIFRKKKLKPCFVHFTGLDDENSKFAMSFADFGGGFYVGGKVDVLAVAFDDAFFKNGIYKACRCAVIKGFWRYLCFQIELNINRMSLIGADFCLVVVEGEAFFVVVFYDVLELVEGDGFAASFHFI